ncbi:rna-directed dna polymerase from mobile element jockey-like [Pitangus sulphuratus]|nr:rna-directed dna polymerase from mobile element jockey-like [Pitangus sulphuratus]
MMVSIQLKAIARRRVMTQKVDELFCKRLADVSQALALVLVEDFYLMGVCWKLNTAEKRQSRRFLECVEDNFLTQLVSEPSRSGAPLDLLFTNKEGLVGDVVVTGHCGHSDKMIEFLILGEVRKGFIKISSLDFWRADFGLLRRLETVLNNKGVLGG